MFLFNSDGGISLWMRCFLFSFFVYHWIMWIAEDLTITLFSRLATLLDKDSARVGNQKLRRVPGHGEGRWEDPRLGEQCHQASRNPVQASPCPPPGIDPDSCHRLHFFCSKLSSCRGKNICELERFESIAFDGRNIGNGGPLSYPFKKV